MWTKHEDPSTKCTLVFAQPKQDEINRGEVNIKESVYECVSCLDDVLFPRNKPLLPSELKKLNTLAILFCVLTFLVAIFLAALSYATFTHSKNCGIFAFAFDAILQAISSSLLIWRFSIFMNTSLECKETVSTISVAFVNSISAVSIIVTTAGLLLSDEKSSYTRISMFVASIRMVLYGILFVAKYKLSRKLGSSALMADAVDSFGGALFGLGVVVSSLFKLVTVKLWFLDDFVALGIAFLMLFYAVILVARQVSMWVKSGAGLNS